MSTTATTCQYTRCRNCGRPVKRPTAKGFCGKACAGEWSQLNQFPAPTLAEIWSRAAAIRATWSHDERLERLEFPDLAEILLEPHECAVA